MSASNGPPWHRRSNQVPSNTPQIIHSDLPTPSSSTPNIAEIESPAFNRPSLPSLATCSSASSKGSTTTPSSLFDASTPAPDADSSPATSPEGSPSPSTRRSLNKARANRTSSTMNLPLRTKLSALTKPKAPGRRAVSEDLGQIASAQPHRPGPGESRSKSTPEHPLSGSSSAKSLLSSKSRNRAKSAPFTLLNSQDISDGESEKDELLPILDSLPGQFDHWGDSDGDQRITSASDTPSQLTILESSCDFDSSNRPSPIHATLDQQYPKFFPYTCKELKQLEINKTIIKLLKRTHKLKKPGWIYIFGYSADPARGSPERVKIGGTIRSPETRTEEWEKCEVPLTIIAGTYQNAFDFHGLVESLIQAELCNKRLRFHCRTHRRKSGRSTVHNEWFEVDHKTGLHHIQRWTGWLLQHKPFDQQGALTPYWHWRVERLPYVLSNVNWDVWTQPRRLDYLDF